MNFSHFFLTLFTLSIFCGGCTKQGQQRRGPTIEAGVLTVGVEVGYPPMEYYDVDGETLVGFDIDLSKALADTLGLRVNYRDTPWEGILSGLDTGKCDIAINITILPERQNNYNFTKPYIDSSITIVGPKNPYLNTKKRSIKKPEDIAGLRIGYQGNTSVQYFAEGLKKQGIDFSAYSYDTIRNCFDDLALGRIDLAAADNIVAFDYTKKENNPFEVLWQGPPNEHIGICLKKGNDILTFALDKALDELRENGTLARLSQKHLMPM